jgi:hypothetical protein
VRIRRTRHQVNSRFLISNAFLFANNALAMSFHCYSLSGLLTFALITKSNFVQAQAKPIYYLQPRSVRILNNEFENSLEERKKAEASRRHDFHPKKVLYIIDRKFIWTEIAPTINLDCISNIRIIADSIAVTLYGSMGADGAVIITTARFPGKYLPHLFTKKGRLK